MAQCHLMDNVIEHIFKGCNEQLNYFSSMIGYWLIASDTC